MISKKGGIFLSVLGILSFVFSVVYISSCTRPIQQYPYTCAGVMCQNGGGCDSGHCVCPTGYEGATCGDVTVQKYYGVWKLHSVVTGSDSVKNINDDSLYVVELKNTSTLTTFFLLGFYNNPSYDLLTCRLDSLDNDVFTFDTTSAINMIYDHFRVRGGKCVMYSRDSISGYIWIRHLNESVNWQNDTLAITLTKN